MRLVAASSFRKCPRVLMILRSCELLFSTAFVVQITLPTSGGNAKSRITPSQALRQAALTGRNSGLMAHLQSYRVWPAQLRRGKA